MARIREIKRVDGNETTGWTPRKGGRPPARTTWEITVSVGQDVGGRWRQRSERITGTYTQAKEKAAALEARYPGRRRTAEVDHTLAEALDRYITHCVTVRRARKTIVGYESIAVTVKARVGSRRLGKLTPADLNDYYAWLRNQGRSSTTIHHHHRLIAAALTHVAKERWLTRPTPADDAAPPALERPEPTAPSPEQVRALVTSIIDASPDMATLITLAALTGCRRGEVCGWRWTDYDSAAGQLTVRRSISDAGGIVEEKATKTGRRRLAIDAFGAALLAAQWDRYVDRCRMAGTEPAADAYVFSQALDHSEPWRPDRVTHTFGRYRQREAVRSRRQYEEHGYPAQGQEAYQQIRSIRLQQMRQFAATQLLAGDVDIRTASARLGHDGAVMLRHYAGVINARDQAAAELLGKLLAPAPADVTPNATDAA